MKTKLPQIAKGCVLPYSIQEELTKEGSSKKEHTRKIRHNYNVALVSAVVGSIAASILSNWSKIIDFILTIMLQ